MMGVLSLLIKMQSSRFKMENFRQSGFSPIIVILILVVLMISAFLWFKQSQPELPNYTKPYEKVTMGISATSLLPSLVHIAEEKGFFLEQGIDVEVKGYPTGKAALSAALEGEIDVGTVADTPIVANSFKRKDFSIFATILDSAQHAKALARKDRNINTPKDLMGKKIGTTIGTTAHFFMTTFFVLNNMDMGGVEIVNLKPKQMVNAIRNGDVDAIFAWEPNIYKANKILGDNAVLLPSKVGYGATFNLISKNYFIENNPELLKRILKALVSAEAFVKDNREESIAIIASRLKIDKEPIEKLWDGYIFKISLSQSLLLTLESEAKWYIRGKLTEGTEVPNYLDYFYLDGLEEVKPEAISIIR
ncbi:MAG: NrtA/SsuA/CpmA family ABC transporter substrate-binding protein [Candidatus Sedimenticola sp. (ex Thyasira tokunagai)]